MALRVVGPAGGELVAAVFAAQDGVGPLPEFDELCGVFGAVKADPVGGGGAMLASLSRVSVAVRASSVTWSRRRLISVSATSCLLHRRTSADV
jgi:hypothetical protein